MRWVGVCVNGNNQSVVQRLPTLRLRFDSSVGQRCLVAQTMNGAHKLTSEGGGSSSGGNGAAAQSKAGASSGNDGGRSTADRLLRQKFFDLLVQVDTRCCVPCSISQRCHVAAPRATTELHANGLLGGQRDD